MNEGRMVRVFSAATLLLSLGVAVVGSSTSATAATKTRKITIAGVYGGTFDPFWISLGCGAKEEATKLGVKYTAYDSSAETTASFSQNFSTALLRHPQGIFADPQNPNQFVTQYKQLMKRGVPVTTINGTTPPTQYEIVGSDVTNLPFLTQLSSLVTKAAGSLAIINGVPGLVPVDDRLDPVVNAIEAANSNLTPLPAEYTFFSATTASQDVSSLLLAHPDLKVIVAADGPDAQGVAAAVQQAGDAGKVQVIGLDATPTEVSYLKSGVITALVAQSPNQIGALQVKQLFQYIKAHPKAQSVQASDTMVGVPQKLLTSSNVGAAANKPWVYQASCS